MKLFNKILKFFGLKKEKPVQKEDTVKYDEMKKFDDEPIEQDEDLDEITKNIIKNIPPINIVPIPTLKKEDIDITKFDEEVKKTKKTTPKKKTAPKKDLPKKDAPKKKPVKKVKE